MSDPTCKDCKHFQQHYGMNAHKLFRLNCGHCVHPRLQTKRPYARVCSHFELAPSSGETFVTKKYLTRELLNCVLRMELLPEISDEPLP